MQPSERTTPSHRNVFEQVDCPVPMEPPEDSNSEPNQLRCQRDQDQRENCERKQHCIHDSSWQTSYSSESNRLLLDSASRTLEASLPDPRKQTFADLGVAIIAIMPLTQTVQQRSPRSTEAWGAPESWWGRPKEVGEVFAINSVDPAQTAGRIAVSRA